MIESWNKKKKLQILLFKNLHSDEKEHIRGSSYIPAKEFKKKI